MPQHSARRERYQKRCIGRIVRPHRNVVCDTSRHKARSLLHLVAYNVTTETPNGNRTWVRFLNGCAMQLLSQMDVFQTDIIPDDLLPHERGSLDQDDPCMPPVIYGL